MTAQYLFSLFDQQDCNIKNVRLTERVNYYNLKVLINRIKNKRLEKAKTVTQVMFLT